MHVLVLLTDQNAMHVLVLLLTQPRSKIVNPEVTRWYHCISRCVRRAFLIAAQRVSEGIEQSHWLVPIEDQRAGGSIRGSRKDLPLANT